MRNPQSFEADSDAPSLSAGVTVSTQLRTFGRLFSCVRDAAARGLRPIVEIDLDLTAVMPIYRTRRALALAGERAGVDLFTHPERLRILPGYSDEAWLAFVAALDLEKAYPKIAWMDETGGPNRDPRGPFAIFHEAYWTVEWIGEDTPTPGLGSFVHRLRQAGGDAVFISGRWLREHIEPTYRTLHRAGIDNPLLVIGNDRHANLVPADQAVSDSQVKVQHQSSIKELGTPISIIDDRISNRKAIMESDPGIALGIAISIPGFTCDPATTAEVMRISTFESFDDSVGDPPVRPYMLEKYGRVGLGKAWHGLYEGLGANSLPYVLPRVSAVARSTDASGPFGELIQTHRAGSLPEEEFLRLLTPHVPAKFLASIDECIEQAKGLAEKSVAAPFPQTAAEQEKLRFMLIASWLHSSDIEHMLASLGYPKPTTGIHDLVEYALSDEIVSQIRAARGKGIEYSDWLLNWVESLPPREMVNVGCLNPHLTAGMWYWKPDAPRQDAMDVHRVSAHHTGDGLERYDPVEAAINDVLHQREGVYGIRKEPIVGWGRMLLLAKRESDAEELARSSAGRDVVRDAIAAGPALELSGVITPWGLVLGASFED